MTSFCIDCIVLRSTKINKSMTRHVLWNSVFSPKVVPNQGCDRYKDLDLQTRYRTRLGWFFWFCPIQRYDTTKGKWQILYLRTRYRTKLGWFFWFGPIHVKILHNLGCNYVMNVSLSMGLCSHTILQSL